MRTCPFCSAVTVTLWLYPTGGVARHMAHLWGTPGSQPRSVTHPWEGLMIPVLLDQKIQALLEHILEEYVSSWYSGITSGTSCPC